MDAGCYPVSFVRQMSGEEPEVTLARSTTFRHPQIDRRTEAEFRFRSGATARITCSMLSRSLVRSSGRIIGEEGTISVVNPFGPQYWHRMKVRSGQGTRVEHTTREPTYHFQLRAFCAAVLEGKPLVTPPDDAVANMEVIDAVYEAAGLLPRGAGT